MSKVYICDFALNCHLGKSKAEVAQRLFDSGYRVEPKVEHLISGHTTPFFQIRNKLGDLERQFEKYNSRNNQIAYSVLKQIKPTVDHLKCQFGVERIAVVGATSTTGIDHFEKYMRVKSKQTAIEKFFFQYQEVGNLNEFISEYLGLKGLSYCISTACSSGGKVFAEGMRLLAANFCDAVVVGGCDSRSELTLNGFDSLGAISDEICNPFSKNRKGINIGEGAAFFVLTREPADFELVSVGESSDAYHISSPEPEGRGAELAIRLAIERGGLKPDDIDYINLHGTATKKNDEMESLLINRVFGGNTPVSSTKPLVGHTLGAAGAIELAFCLMAIEHQKLPPQRGDRQWDTEGKSIRFVENSNMVAINHIMSNSFAFGGSNVSVIVRGRK